MTDRQTDILTAVLYHAAHHLDEIEDLEGVEVSEIDELERILLGEYCLEEMNWDV